MRKSVKVGFELSTVDLDIKLLVENKTQIKSVLKTEKYSQIEQSIREIGIVEPIVVFPRQDGQFTILDGHIRYWVLKELAEREVVCLIAKDDEAYTYNKKINRLSSVQEHFMILRAIDKGVSEEKIAKVLNVVPETIRKKRNLLNGICPEVVELIRHRQVKAETIKLLKKLKPLWQIKFMEQLIQLGTFKSEMLKAMIQGAPDNSFIKPRLIKDKKDKQVLIEIEQDIVSLVKEAERMRATHGENILKLTTLGAYIGSMLDNVRVRKYIKSNFPEILSEFEDLVSIYSREDST